MTDDRRLDTDGELPMTDGADAKAAAHEVSTTSR